MPSAAPIITPPRVPLVDPRTGLIDRTWYLFFLSLNGIATGVVDNPDIGPTADSLIASYDAALQALTQEVETQPVPADLTAELIKQIEAAGLIDCCSGLLSQVAELQKQVEALQSAPVAAPSSSSSGADAANISGGAANQILYQSAASTTAFIAAPTTATTYLEWNGSAFTWSAVSATVNWAVPGALGSTTPNSVYVNEGGANRLAFFDPTIPKKITSNDYFKADPDGNGTISIYGAATNNYSVAASFGYVSGGNGTTLSCFFGAPNNGADACVVSSNAYWDPGLSTYVYDKTNSAAMWVVASGTHIFRTASSGTAGTSISWIQPLELTTSFIYFNLPIATSVKSSSASAGVGYATGAGNSITQLTSKSTAVTLNNICGKIQMSAASLAANTNVSFTFNNSTIAATDVVIVNASNVAGSAPTANTYIVVVDAVLAGSCRILVRNTSASSAAQALILNFAVIKAVQA